VNNVIFIAVECNLLIRGFVIDLARLIPSGMLGEKKVLGKKFEASLGDLLWIL